VAYGPPVIPEITDDHLDRVSPRVDDLMVAIRRNIPAASSPELMRFHCAGIPPQLHHPLARDNVNGLLHFLPDGVLNYSFPLVINDYKSR